jgi:hypothetical protein
MIEVYAGIVLGKDDVQSMIGDIVRVKANRKTHNFLIFN